MGNVNLLAVVLGAAAFFAVGALWYTALFGRVWQRHVGLSDEQLKGGNMAVIFGLTFLFEMLVSLMLGHNIARTDPSDRAIMMMAVGFGLTIMVPAIGINYLYQRKSGTLFAIDAGHFVLGTTAMGLVHVLLR